MRTPDWYALLLIGLGVFRICRLAGWDDLTTPLRAKVIGLSDEAHSQWTYVLNALQGADRDPWLYDRTYEDSMDFIVDTSVAVGRRDNLTMPPLVSERLVTDPLAGDAPAALIVPFTQRRWYVSKLMRCPWCLGFWITLAAWLSYQAWPDGTLVVMSLLAASAIPGLVTKNLDKD